MDQAASDLLPRRRARSSARRFRAIRGRGDAMQRGRCGPCSAAGNRWWEAFSAPKVTVIIASAGKQGAIIGRDAARQVAGVANAMFPKTRGFDIQHFQWSACRFRKRIVTSGPAPHMRACRRGGTNVHSPRFEIRAATRPSPPLLPARTGNVHRPGYSPPHRPGPPGAHRR